MSNHAIGRKSEQTKLAVVRMKARLTDANIIGLFDSAQKRVRSIKSMASATKRRVREIEK